MICLATSPTRWDGSSSPPAPLIIEALIRLGFELVAERPDLASQAHERAVVVSADQVGQPRNRLWARSQLAVHLSLSVDWMTPCPDRWPPDGLRVVAPLRDRLGGSRPRMVAVLPRPIRGGDRGRAHGVVSDRRNRQSPANLGDCLRPCEPGRALSRALGACEGTAVADKVAGCHRHARSCAECLERRVELLAR